VASDLAAHGRVLGSSAISDGGGHEETGAVSRRQGGTHLGLEEGGLEESGGMETDGTAARDGAQAEEKEKERVGEAAASSRLERAQPISRGRSRTSTPIEESVVEGGGETEGGAQCQPDGGAPGGNGCCGGWTDEAASSRADRIAPTRLEAAP